MTLTRPLAFQSCCPGQPRGSLVHAVHAHRCAACHGQNHSRQYRQWAGHRAHALISINLFPKPLPRVLACFRVRQGFFHMSRPVCQAPAIWPSVSHQTAQRDRIGRRRDGLSPPAQASPGRSSGPSDAWGPGSNPPGPTPDRGNSNREPLRGFSRAPAFPLPYRKNMPTKGYRICHDKQYHINVAKLQVKSAFTNMRFLRLPEVSGRGTVAVIRAWSQVRICDPLKYPRSAIASNLSSLSAAFAALAIGASRVRSLPTVVTSCATIKCVWVSTAV